MNSRVHSIDPSCLAQATWDQTNVGIRITDATGELLAVNPAYCHMVDQQEKELLGRPFIDSFTNEERETLLSKYREAFQKEKSIPYTIHWHTLHNGPKFVWGVSTSFIRLAEHGPVGMSFCHDITHIYRHTKRKHQFKRMSALANLAAGVVHEFNNVLTAIETETSLGMMNLPENHPLASRFQTIHGEVERGASLMRQLQAFSQQETSEKEPIRLSTVLESFQKLIRKYVGEHISVQFDSEENLPEIMANRTQIEQVIIQLCMNAKEAMPEGGLLTLRTYSNPVSDQQSKAEGLDEDTVILEVRDTGSGIDGVLQEHIFEPYVTTKSHQNHPGMGLSYVHGIVLSHDGRVEVESDSGEGSSFRCFFPVVVEADPTQKDDQWQSASPDLIGKTCLLVEDDVNLRMMIREILENVGLTILVASDTDEALDLVNNAGERVDMIISDVILPSSLNGMDLLVRLRETDPELRGILMTGYPSESLPDEISDQSGVPLLRKPFQSSQLIQAIQKCFATAPEEGGTATRRD